MWKDDVNDLDTMVVYALKYVWDRLVALLTGSVLLLMQKDRRSFFFCGTVLLYPGFLMHA